MDIYLVGGAVRDKLLGLAVTEHDWVVVGATPGDLTKLGYRPVGKDFPVFLHPETGEEYALARTERKTGRGHRGFQCDSSTSVTIEDDLLRRDFTINAIAEDPDGNLIDPYGGRKDMDARIFRHISPAFEEDPLRVIRAARFKAKLHHLGFKLHPDTISLLQRMVARGDLAELPPERIYGELEKALQTLSADVFFRQMHELGAGRILWPEIDESDFDLLARISDISDDPITRFASLAVNLRTEDAESLCARLKVPSKYSETAILVAQYYDPWKNVLQMSAEEIVELLGDVDAVRRPERFIRISHVCRMIQALNDEAMAHKNHAAWLDCHQIANSVRARDVDDNVAGPALGKAIKQKQIQLIKRGMHHG